MNYNQDKSLPELRSLTSLRGLAALVVVMQHFSTTAQEWCLVSIPSLVPHGYVAVDFFFVLSGFIMVYNYQGRFKVFSMSAYRSFIKNRIARIMPLNFFALTCIITLGLVLKKSTGRDIIYLSDNIARDFASNLLLLQGLGIGTNLNGPSWSISAEFLAYLIFPVLLFLSSDGSGRKLFSVVTAVTALFILAMQTPRLLMTFEGPPLSLVRCFSEFILGMAAHSLLSSPATLVFLRQDLTTLTISLAVGLSLLMQSDLPAILLFPFLVVSYAVNKDIASRIIQIPVFYFLGEISFSLYLLHNPMRPLELMLLQNQTGKPVGAAVALSFAFLGALSVIPVAWFGYQVIERPGRNLLRHLSL